MTLPTYLFPVSGVETSILLPPAVALVIAAFSSMGGVSGAFLLIPFQMDLLHYTAPSVSATNFVYNIVAIPSGLYRFIKEGRMVWPLTWTIVLGTLPGILVGYFLRVHFLPDPGGFKLFVGCVLLYVAARLVAQVLRTDGGQRHATGAGAGAADAGNSVVRTISASRKRTEYEFRGVRYVFRTGVVFVASFVVGVIGGVYGIGGGAIIAPFCVSVLHLPVHTVAGAVLMGTFAASLAGVGFYSLLPAPETLSTSPDWLLGLLFGVGGLAGIYVGTRLQKHVPERFIKGILGAATLFVAVRYILGYFK